MHTNPRLAWRNPARSTPRPLVSTHMKHFLVGVVTWPFSVLLFVVFLAVIAVVIVCAALCVILWPLLMAYSENRRPDKKKV